MTVLNLKVKIVELKKLKPVVYIASTEVGGMRITGHQTTSGPGDAVKSLFEKLSGSASSEVNMAILIAASGETMESLMDEEDEESPALESGDKPE